MKIKYITIITLIALIGLTAHTTSEPTEGPSVWKVLMAEAVSEGYNGMYAVACVIRNRGGDLDGFCGAKREDLDVFCEGQGERHILLAKHIERIVFQEKGKDITFGASHFENIKKFGKPYWAERMKETATIGSHTFYKKS
jgi:hypothetical protein